MDKVSYALGLGIGRQLQDLCGEDLNINDFTQAVRDLLTGNHLAIDEIEGQQLVIEFLQRRDAERKSEQAKLGEAAKRAGEEYLEKNGIFPDMLINNAGFMLPFAKFEKYSQEEIDDLETYILGKKP